MKRSNYILFGLLAVVAYLAYSYYSGGFAAGAVNSIIGFVSGAFPSDWLTRGSSYVPYINQVEQRFGLPQDFLAAVAYQESSFDPSAVNSSSGAMGMFQLLPRYYPAAGQNWQADAQTAAGALAGYYREFGDWQLALAAYNWGPGNVNTWLGNGEDATALPSETSNYVGRIAQATGIEGSLIAV